MNDASFNNALILGVLILVISLLVGRLVYRAGESKDAPAGLRPFGNSGKEAKLAEAMTQDEITGLLARRYKVKFAFRLGVLLCSAGAFSSYLFLQSRLAAIMLIICAGICQYGVYRQKTNSYLSTALTRQAGVPENVTNGCGGTKTNRPEA